MDIHHDFENKAFSKEFTEELDSEKSMPSIYV